MVVADPMVDPVVSFLVGLLVLVVGFPLANYVAGVVRRSDALEEADLAPYVASGTRATCYYAVVVIALETMGFNVAILYTIAETIGFAIALAAALAVGIAFGWGGKEHAAEYIDDWLSGSTSEEERRTSATTDD